MYAIFQHKSVSFEAITWFVELFCFSFVPTVASIFFL